MTVWFSFEDKLKLHCNSCTTVFTVVNNFFSVFKFVSESKFPMQLCFIYTFQTPTKLNSAIRNLNLIFNPNLCGCSEVKQSCVSNSVTNAFWSCMRFVLFWVLRVANHPAFPGTSLCPASRLMLPRDAECPIFPKNGRMS